MVVMLLNIEPAKTNIHMKKSGTLLIRCLLVLFSMIGNTVLADNYQEGAIRYFNNLPESVSVSEKPVIEELIDDVDDAGEEENHYDAILKKVIDEKRVTSQLDSSTFLSLPVAIQSNIGNNANLL